MNDRATDRVPGAAHPPSHFPPSIPPNPKEQHGTVVAEDGTRLFVRTMERNDREESGHENGHPVVNPPDVPAPNPHVTTILCDGILCDGFIWKYLWSDLAEVSDVAHWHYRGHGRSGAPVDPTRIDIAAHADDFMSVRRSLGDPPCVLVGHSMGTQVVLETWRRHPDKVKGLVLVCGSFGKLTQSFRGVPILDAILPKLLDIVDKQPDIVRAIWSRVPPEMTLKAALLSRDIDPSHVRREDMMPYLQHMTHVDFPLFLRMLRAAGDHSSEEYLSKIDIPVLVVAGEKDTFTPASLSEFMAREIPGAELLMVPGGTHVTPIEHVELVDGRIKEFVTRVSQG